MWLSFALQAALLGLFLWMVAGLLTPVALGAIFALLLHPLQKKLSRRLGRRAAWSPLLVTMAAILLGVIPVALISAKAVVSINAFLATDWTRTLEAVRVYFAQKLEGYARDSNFAEIGTAIENLVRQLGSTIAGALGSFALTIKGKRNRATGRIDFAGGNVVLNAVDHAPAAVRLDEAARLQQEIAAARCTEDYHPRHSSRPL